MDRTQRLRPLPMDAQAATPRYALALMLALALAIMVVADVALVLRPQLAHELGRFWTDLFAGHDGRTWLIATTRAALSVGGVALAVLTLATFARGVQRSPYVWLAPILVGFSAVVIVRTTAALPLPVPAPVFAALVSLLLLGGGALVQLQSVVAKTAGVLVLSAPLLFLGFGLSQSAHGASGLWAAPSDATRLLLFVTTMTAFGLGFVALASASPAFSEAANRKRRRSAEQHALREALERASQSDARASLAEDLAARAEQALRAQGAQLEAALAAQEELEGFRVAARPRALRIAIASALVAGLAAAVWGGYAALLRPLQRQAHAAQAELVRAQHAHAQATTALQAQLAQARAAGEQDLATHAAAVSSAGAELTRVQEQLSSCTAQLTQVATPAAREPAARATPKARRAHAKPQRRAPSPAAKPESKPESTKPGVAASDDPLLGI